ncbi:DUF1194 domain-containing protein [Sabulicella glaciei]|uniref:DUF1194 domain-containing protein n=1 Tax=Sabulicella glaciei TaxID=2984948 RepID=A0ABT3NVK8_9PROT|nr:DUF1194 domain-containing protein [Roseococcus sp. MDT2-1-1]MCW8086202.1 DUF1194 domain-containing protein [Roseococcus sp. MDT2-1-1]
MSLPLMEAVDLALVLAVDVSASVDFDEFALMLGGLAAAFRDEGVQAATAAGPRGAVAVAVLFWSEAQEVAVPWMRIAGPAEAEALARALEEAPRQPRAAATAIGEALVAALALLARCPAEAPRLVVDVSGDGRSNRGRPPGPVRDLGVAAGAVINGLAVLNEEADLLAHYEAEVIGGTGCFAMECADYGDFAEAIRRKLLREMRGAPLLA